MSDIVKGILEDVRKGILLSDFAGGVVTDTGGLSLGANQSPDALNVLAWEGNLLFRGGYSQWSSLPYGADAAFTYYDASQTKHMLEWAGGNIYDVSSATPAVVATGVYTPGEQIAHAQLNGVCYWSTLSVPLRQYDGVTEMQVVNGGGVGTVPPPNCSFLVVFNGSLIAVNVVVSGVANPGAFMWSNVNNPNVWVGANTQVVGSNDGGSCVFAILMGVAQVGVTPTKQFMVGKNNRQMFLYQGALGAMTENAISSPVGIMSGNSAIYIPTQQGLGAVMFLGQDAQFYLCNGIETTLISAGIKTLCYNLVNAALTANPLQKFEAVYNQRFLYYMCDFGNQTQLVYKWDTGAWWVFKGWPSGPFLTAPAPNGLPSVFVGANGVNGTTGVYQIALDDTNDNGADPEIYWTSAYIHGGKPERLKLFQEITMFAYNKGVTYEVTATGMPRSDGSVDVTTPLVFNDPAVGNTLPPPGVGAFWGAGKWGAALWSGAPVTAEQPLLIGGMRGPLVVPSGVTKWARAGMPLPLRTGAAQFKIAWKSGVPDFRLTSFKVAFLMQNENVGNLPFSTQGQVVANNATGAAAGSVGYWGNRFTNTGNTRLRRSTSVAPPAAGIINYSPYENAEYFYAIAAGQHELIAASPDGAYIYLGAATNSFNDSVVLKINASTGSNLAVSAAQVNYQVQMMCVSPDGTKLYVMSRNDSAGTRPTLLVYRTSDMTLQSTTIIVASDTIESMDLSFDGATLAFCGDAGGGTIYLINTSTLGVSSFVLGGGAIGIDHARFALNGNLYVADEQAVVGGVRITEVTTGGVIVAHYAISLFAGSPTIAPFAVHPTTGVIYGCQQNTGNQYLFAYSATGGLLASTAISHVATAGYEVQGVAINPANTTAPYDAYFTTQSDALWRFNQVGATASVSLTNAQALTTFFSGIAITNGVAYISASGLASTYYALIDVVALP